jgi:phenylalanyl-tRNA synthetase alpha subunit
MSNIAGGMKFLCEDIITGCESRKSTIKNLKGKVKALRDNARKFLADSKKLHEKMTKDLKESLQEGRKDLVKNVNDLRRNFRKKEKQVKTDLAEASKIWNRMNESLRNIKEI